MQRTDYQDQIIWIIGASSGIGAALARELAARGATLALSARRQEALDRLNTLLGGSHGVFAVDVRDAAQVQQSAQSIHTRYGRIDRVIYLAAAYTPMTLTALDLNQVRQIVEVNVTGAFQAVHAVLPLLQKQPMRGQIALCGSVAGYTGLPGGQPYSATKAAIINLAESLHAECGDWMDIKLISPGFVSTPLTAKNDFAMPMIITPEQAARAIADGLRTRRFEIHFPRRFTLFLKCLRILPYVISLPLLKYLKR